jgi:hypothetical protein
MTTPADMNGAMMYGDVGLERAAARHPDAQAGQPPDEVAGAMVRPYTVTGGRTRPTRRLDLLSLVTPTGQADPAALTPDHASALALCDPVASIAEVAARMHLPVVAVKILVSDLIDYGAAATRTDGLIPKITIAAPTTAAASTAAATAAPAMAVELPVLERVLNGLRQL